jgi:hypothetical protein
LAKSRPGFTFLATFSGGWKCDLSWSSSSK